MGDDHAFLPTFALVLCTAAITTVVFQRLKQPVILGYLLAGVMVGPYVTLVPVTADRVTTETLAELGVILLLFSIGLEFSIRRLLRVGPSVAVTALFDVTMMAFLGLTRGVSPRLDAARGALHRRPCGDLQHHDHREDVRGSRRRAEAARPRLRRAHRRGPRRRPLHGRSRDARRDRRHQWGRAAGHRHAALRPVDGVGGWRAARRAAADALHRAPQAAGDDAGRVPGHLLRLRAAGPVTGLLRGARRLHRGLADQRIREGPRGDGTGAPGARRLRRGLLRLGRHADPAGTARGVSCRDPPPRGGRRRRQVGRRCRWAPSSPGRGRRPRFRPG